MCTGAYIGVILLAICENLLLGTQIEVWRIIRALCTLNLFISVHEPIRRKSNYSVCEMILFLLEQTVISHIVSTFSIVFSAALMLLTSSFAILRICNYRIRNQ